MKKSLGMILSLTMGVLGATTTFAGSTPKNALGGVAVSSDGKLLAAAGDNRVLYVIDPSTLEVKQRIWIEINPLEVYFSSDAKVLMITSTDSEVSFYDTKTWQKKGTLDGVDLVAYAADADVLLAAKDGYKKSEIKLVDPATGEVRNSFTLETSLAGVGITPDGKQIAVLTDNVKTEDEPKEKAPKELDGVEETEFELKHDGKVARILWFDNSGQQVKEVQTWYSPGSTDNRLLMPDQDNLYIINYSNANAHVKGDELSLFELPNSYNYGHGTSASQKWLGTGGLRTGTVSTVGGEMTAGTPFKADKLPGWPEYYKGFSISEDGTAFAGTTAYRVLRIKADGSIEKTAPIY